MQHSPNKLSTLLQIFFSRLIPEVDPVHEGDDVVSGLTGAVPHKVVISRESGHFSMHAIHIFSRTFFADFSTVSRKRGSSRQPERHKALSEIITLIL